MFKKLLFLLLPLAACCGKEIYVDINASAPGKGTQSSPFTAIQQAADAVEPGDTVIIKPGVYFETVRLKRFGTEERDRSRSCRNFEVRSGRCTRRLQRSYC